MITKVVRIMCIDTQNHEFMESRERHRTNKKWQRTDTPNILPDRTDLPPSNQI